METANSLQGKGRKSALLNIAHRGARSLAPENTLAAAKKAYDVGADMWELDVAVTSDGELVVIHDDTLERTSNAPEVFPNRKPWAVHTFLLSELQKLDFGSWFNIEDPFKQIAAGKVSQADQYSYVGERIPTLREALTFTQANNWKVNVEIKDASGTPGDKVVVRKVNDLLVELNMVDRVMVSSFNHSYIQQIRVLNPKLKTAALVEHNVPDPVALLKKLDAQAFNPNPDSLPDHQVKTLRQAGDEVYVWTVNDPALMRHLARLGVNGIFTDFPQILQQALAGE